MRGPVAALLCKFGLILACIAGCALTCLLGWPGAVSVDMFQTINEAAHGRYAGHYDPMAAIIWMLPLSLVDIPTAVATIFSLQAIAQWAIFCLLGWHALRMGSLITAVVLVAIAYLPPFLCYSIAIESNLQVAVWWGLGVAICIVGGRPWHFCAALPLLWIGFTGRYGMVVSLVPVIYCCARMAIKAWSARRLMVLAVAIAALFHATAAGAKKFVLQAPAPISILSVSQLFDIAGVYKETGRSFAPPFCVPEGSSLDDIVASYEPRNCVPMFWSVDGKPIFNRPKSQADADILDVAWRQAIQEEPMAYLKVKARFADAFLMWSYDMAYGVLPDFSGAAYIGVEAPADPSKHPLARLAYVSMYWFVWRGWIWSLCAIVVVVLAIVVRTPGWSAALSALMAGFFMMVPFMLFGQGLSCRYYVPIFMMFVVVFAVALPSLEAVWMARFRAIRAESRI